MTLHKSRFTACLTADSQPPVRRHPAIENREQAIYGSACLTSPPGDSNPLPVGLSQ